MNELFETKRKRRILIWISITILTILFFLRKYTLHWLFNEATAPTTYNITVSLVDNLFATILTTLMIAWLIFWLNPPEIQTGKMIETIDPYSIPEIMLRAREGTLGYWYSGGTGRHTRAVTLPKLASDSRARGVSIDIHIQVIDPRNAQLCGTYAEYRNALRSADGKPKWSPERVRNESLATIISAYCHRSLQPSLRLSITLKPMYSLLRIDMSQSHAIITKEDPREPALCCRSGTLFYNAYREDMNLSAQQGTSLPATLVVPTPNDLTSTSVSQILRDLNLLPEGITDKDLEEICNAVKTPEKPYAN